MSQETTIEIAVTKLSFGEKTYTAEVIMGFTPYRISGLKTDTMEEFVAECAKWHKAGEPS